MKIILFPGLGYDCRIFDNLSLEDFEVDCLNWIEPQRNEKINDYAQRMYSKCDSFPENKILIGHSMGGIIAQEIASVYEIDKVILISSIKSRTELPLHFKLVKFLRLSKFFTKQLSISTVKYWGKNHGFEMEKEKELFKSMIDQQTNFYLQWALRSLCAWQEPKNLGQTELIHIHGTNDKTLPYKLVSQPDYTVKNGSHICVYKQADIISEWIKEILN